VRAEAAPGKPFDHGRFELVVEPFPEAEAAQAREIAVGLREWLG
jgi:hypothetical protein